MSVLSGSMSFKAYYLESHTTLNFEQNEWLEKLSKGIFKGIDKDKNQKEAYGFTDSMDVFATNLNINNLFIENYVYFNFRRDVIKLQKKMLNVFIKEVENKYKGDNLTKNRMKDIKIEAENLYAQKVLPNVYSYEVVWNYEAGILYFFNNSKSINEKFVDFFEKVTDLSLIEIETSTIAYKLLNEKQFQQFEKLPPSTLVTFE